MKRRTVLVWRWTVASVAACGLAWAGAAYLAREDTRAVLAGDRSTAGLTDDLARALPDDCPRLSFSDAAAELGLDGALPTQFRGARTRLMPEDTGGGIALCDLDGDGDADLLLVGSGSLPDGGPSYLLRNDTPPGGALAFTDVTDGAGLPGVTSPLVGFGAAVADVDADGDLDVLITHLHGLRLLRNDGELRFSDVTEAAGLADAPGWCSGAAFGDADGDGDLDLYVCRYVRFEPVAGLEENLQYGAMIPYTLNPSSFRPQTNLFFENDGGVFEGGEQAAQNLGIHDPRGRSLGVVWADFDQDGLPDIYVANDVSDNVLLQGRVAADGTRGFEDRSHATATADYRGAMGLAVADADADGDDEIFVTHWTAQENGFYRNLLHDARGPGGALVFMDEADRVGLGAVALDFVGWATDFVDLDLDGRLDLFVANGATLEESDDRSKLRAERPLLFWNGGEGGYFDVRGAWGDDVLRPRVLRGGAAADLDGDRDLDIVMGALDGPPVVLRNEGEARGRALAVRLRSSGRNTFGVGARVTVTCGGLTLAREMRSSPGYLSAGPLVLYFGLGVAVGPANVHVRWPDGEESELTVAPERSDVLVRQP